jgi:histidine ammonia-lyase
MPSPAAWARSREEVHALRPHPGQVQVRRNLLRLLDGSTLADIPYHLVPRFRQWLPRQLGHAAAQALRFDIGWDWVPFGQRHGREKFYQRFLPFRGGKKHQPQDSYSCAASRRCTAPCAMRWSRPSACSTSSSMRSPTIRWCSPTSRPSHVEEQVISAGHFHGMPLALAMSYLKAAIPCWPRSERRLNKLVDPATNDGLPAFLIGNEDGTESGHMIVQYTAAAIVNDLASRAHPASVYSIPTSANAEDHVSMGANEARHVLAMAPDLGKVLALELYTAAQALEYRQDMLNAARADGAELTGGPIHGYEVECPRHGSRFDVRTGEALCPPAYLPTAKFPVKVEDGWVYSRDDR